MPRKSPQMSFPQMESDEVANRSAPNDRGTARLAVPQAERNDPPGATSPEPPPAPESVSAEAATSGGFTVYVVDVHNLIYQVFHAIPEMSSPRGEPVGAVFGLARDLLFLLEEKRPDCLLCAFDMPGKTFRHELYDAYKSERPPMPEDLRPQIDKVRTLLEALGLPQLGVEGFEADDILATVARRAVEAGGTCVLVTGDKDSRQLLSDRVSLLNIRKNEIFDEAALLKEWGVRPGQVVDFQAMVGDRVDGVPGVPLIGPKVARELLAQYGTLEEVLAHAQEVQGAKRRQNLVEFREQALMSQTLVRLNTEVPLALDWDACRVQRFDAARVRELFVGWGFRSLAQRIAALAARLPERAAGTGVVSATPKPEIHATYHLVDTPELFSEFLGKLRAQPWFSLDTETTDVRPCWAEIVGLSFAWDPQNAYYLPLRAPQGEAALDPGATLSALKPILEDPRVGKVGQNLKYDRVVLRTAGVDVRGTAFDTVVASYLLDAGSRSHSLDELARRYLGHETIKIAELIGSGRDQKRMDEVSTRRVADYSGEDALLPVLLRPILERHLEESELAGLFHNLEIPLVDVLVELESNGVKIAPERLGGLSERFGARMEAAEAEIESLAGHPLNTGSPKQLREVLFDELKLPVVKKTKTGPSTDHDVLEELAPLHPLPARIVEYRQYAKLKSTYVDALPTMICPRTGRVHASFHQDVTATGRLSSSDPNLQNIPVRTEEGREIRSAFVPGEAGWLLLAADYSQIELRVLAHYSGDARLVEAFANDEDIHARVASQIAGVPLAEVTPSMRRQAKTVNFGVIYGQSPFGLARQLGIEQEAAAQFIQAYFAEYPGIEGFLAGVLADCRRLGYVKTLLGRRRAVQGVRPEPSRQRNLAERTAINTVIQGSAADLMKLAMLAMHRRLERERFPAKMLLQIHDELIFEVPAERRDDLARMAREEMAGVATLRVPLKVDVKAGGNWAEAEPLLEGA